MNKNELSQAMPKSNEGYQVLLLNSSAEIYYILCKVQQEPYFACSRTPINYQLTSNQYELTLSRELILFLEMTVNSGKNRETPNSFRQFSETILKIATPQPTWGIKYGDFELTVYFCSPMMSCRTHQYSSSDIVLNLK